MIDLSNIAAPKFSNTTITSSGLTTGSGVTYTNGTSVSPTWAVNNSIAQSGKMTLLGDEADLVINGKSLTATLQALEERLNILVPNTELEEEWEELAELGDQYRQLEKELKEKVKMWKVLKKT